jgi:hypothetical protein
LLTLAATAALAAVDEPRTIFNGKDAAGWTTNAGQPVPPANVQPDGLNPHEAGGYLVVYEKPFKDFILDFDYKLSKGCNSGVFLRVGDLKDPVMTGLEVALDDTEGTGFHDSGAIYDLKAPEANAQKPAGEWNHMTIAARGPIVTVTLNGREVNRIDLSRFTAPGKRPDGSDHKFRDVTVKDLEQKGYLGFQDHGSDCWFKAITLRPLD